MCSGHGVCKNMAELALQTTVVKPEEWVNTPEQVTVRYGTVNGSLEKTTWDAEVMRYVWGMVCVCVFDCVWGVHCVCYVGLEVCVYIYIYIY